MHVVCEGFRKAEQRWGYSATKVTLVRWSLPRFAFCLNIGGGTPQAGFYIFAQIGKAQDLSVRNLENGSGISPKSATLIGSLNTLSLRPTWLRSGWGILEEGDLLSDMRLVNPHKFWRPENLRMLDTAKPRTASKYILRVQDSEHHFVSGSICGLVIGRLCRLVLSTTYSQTEADSSWNLAEPFIWL